MDVLMISKTVGEKSFPLSQAEKIICYQLQKKITGDRAWHLSSDFKYEIVEGASCCKGHKGKVVISKVTTVKSKTSKTDK